LEIIQPTYSFFSICAFELTQTKIDETNIIFYDCRFFLTPYFVFKRYKRLPLCRTWRACCTCS